MQHSWPPLDGTFFETMVARKIVLPSSLRRYFRDFMGFEPTAEELVDRRMEEVFKDVFYDFLEAPGDRVAYNAYIALVDLYLRVLRDTTNWLGEDKRKGAPIGRLLGHAAKSADELTVITFNHDLVIENEILKRPVLRRRWCLDRGYGSLGSSLDILATESDSVFPVHTDGGCSHTNPITVLKLHGSLNWMVRLKSGNPTANYLSGKAGHRRIYLGTLREITGRTTIVRSGSGRTSWPTWPVVVPPVYAKQALRSAIQVAWTDARNRLESADRIVFFGYSLPAIDIEAEKLFERAMASNRDLDWIDVINPSPETAARYAGLAPALPVRWYPSLKGFLEADSRA